RPLLLRRRRPRHSRLRLLLDPGQVQVGMPARIQGRPGRGRYPAQGNRPLLRSYRTELLQRYCRDDPENRMIDFSVEPEFQAKLDWMDKFVREECETMDLLFPEMGAAYDVKHAPSRRHLKPLQAKVKAQGLWACHLGPNLGGPGYGQVKLALMNEILGPARSGPIVFGCQAPDSGNAEILAHYGTPEQKERWLRPLLDNEVVS